MNSRENRKWGHLYRKKKTFAKNTRAKRHSNYYGCVKVAKSMAWVIRGTSFFYRPLGRMGGSKGAFLENPENRKRHQKHSFRNSSALGPFKNGLRKRFWTNIKNQWKNDWKINVSWWPKPLKAIWKQTLFLDFGHFQKLIKKRCRRETQKSCLWVQTGDMRFPGSTYSLIFDVLVWCLKMTIFGSPPIGPTNYKNRCNFPFRTWST